MSSHIESEGGMEDLVRLSREFGSNPEFVLAGGGNTSWKQGDLLYVKASGTSLADITPAGFVPMDLGQLNAIWDTSYPYDPAERESAVLHDMMAARVPKASSLRPSVETLLHALFPYRWVVHTHPALVNGVTCAVKGREFVAADSIEEIMDLYTGIFTEIRGNVRRFPVSTALHVELTARDRVKEALVTFLKEPVVLEFNNSEIETYARSEEHFLPLSLGFTPDHIVYCGYRPLYVPSMEELNFRLESFVQKESFVPRIIVVRGTGAFAAGSSLKSAETARGVFLDGVNIAVYTESFGGYSFMPEDNLEFIRTWEMEKFRASVHEDGDRE